MMAYLPELEPLLSSRLLSKAERKGLMTTVIARVTIMAAVLVLLVASLFMAHTELHNRVIMACAVVLAAGHLVLTFRNADYRIRGGLFVAGILAAGILSEVDMCRLFFGRSSMFLAIPAVIVPVVIGSRYCFLYWVIVEALTVALAINAPHHFSIFPSVMLLIICTVSWMTTARAEREIELMDRLRKKAEAEMQRVDTAIGILVDAETTSLTQLEMLWDNQIVSQD